MHATHFVRNGRLLTAYHETGSGRPFVLVHGYTGSKLDFHDQLDDFADLRRVIAYDNRGHGESSNQAPYDLDTLAEDLISLLDALAIDRCDLLGHSLGGMVAMRAVLSHPERFDSLILMDTSAAAIPAMPEKVRRRMYELVTERGCAALLPQMREAPPTPAQRRGVDYLGEAEHWRRITTKLEQMDPLAFTELGARMRDQTPVVDRLGAIGCPTTVIVGEHDTAFLEPSAALAGAIPGARLVTIDGAAHSPQYENADAWREAIRRHLE